MWAIYEVKTSQAFEAYLTSHGEMQQTFYLTSGENHEAARQLRAPSSLPFIPLPVTLWWASFRKNQRRPTRENVIQTSVERGEVPGRTSFNNKKRSGKFHIFTEGLMKHRKSPNEVCAELHFAPSICDKFFQTAFMLLCEEILGCRLLSLNSTSLHFFFALCMPLVRRFAHVR